MKKLYFLISIISFLLSDVNAQQPYAYYFNAKLLNANYIHVPFTNYGNINSDLSRSIEFDNAEYHLGANWYHYNNERETIVYEHGLFFTGKINNVKYLAESVWAPFFTPGPVLNSKPARLFNPSDSLRYRVYKISSDNNSGIDLKEWPIDLGAPVTANNKPKLYGDQTVWTVYNALDSIRPGLRVSQWTKYPVSPIEVHQTAYSYNLDKNNPDNYLNDIVFIEWQVINECTNRIDSAVIGLFTDIDFYGENNFPAVDTTLKLGYCWSNGSSGYYDSSKIPAVGYMMLYGPAVPSAGDTAVFKGNKKLNFRNLPPTSFWGFHDDSFADTSSLGPAYSVGTAWNIAHGLDKQAKKITDPVTGMPTSFRYAGDPVTNTGWLSNKNPTGGGAGFYLFSGNFTLAPSDTQWVMFALMAAKGGDNFKSITKLRDMARYLKNIKYDDLVRTSQLEYKEPVEILPSGIELLQNYPNPFNNSTTIIYGLKEQHTIRIELFNLLGQKIKTLFEGVQKGGYHQLRLEAGSLSGGVYFYRIISDSDKNTLTKKLVLLK